MGISRRTFLERTTGLGFAATVCLTSGEAAAATAPVKQVRSAPSSEAWFEIDPERLGANLDSLRRLVKVPIMAVIKANAYGHGLLPIGRYLDQAKIGGLMVCRMSEAVALRDSGVTCPIYNFGPLLPDHHEILIRRGITPILSGRGFEELDRTARRLGEVLDAHIHVDTGMHRMGIPAGEATSAFKTLSRCSGLRVSGISTTLTEDKEFDTRQLSLLKDLAERAKRQGLSPAIRHAASSAALFVSSDFYLEMVRPGIAVYGYYPNPESREGHPLDLKPILTFKTRVAEVKSLAPGEGVSYHRAYRASRSEKIAVLPVGYSDGYPPRASGQGHVLIRDTPCSIIATITANHMEVRIPEGIRVYPGDPCVLIGRQGSGRISADDLAAWSGRSNYQVLIGLNPLLPRVLGSAGSAQSSMIP